MKTIAAGVTGSKHAALPLLMVWEVIRPFVLLAVWAVASGFLAAHAETPSLTELEVKAGFLYHFARFVEWPSEVFSSRNNTFTIGVLGADRFGVVLDEIMWHKTIHDKHLVVKRFTNIEDARQSQLLFISSSEASRLPYILKVLEGASVLTVGEMDRFARRGGMSALRMEGKKVRFDINLNAAARVGLKMSSQLLKLARIVDTSG